MIFHIVAKESWEQAKREGAYRGDTLNSEGFIHCSRFEQVEKVANARFRGRDDLLLLQIDPSRVQPEIKYEEGEPGELFPHIYGPLNVDAVMAALSFRAEPDGIFRMPDQLSPSAKEDSVCSACSLVNAAAAILLLAGLWFLLQRVDLGEFGKGDFLQYWAGAKLFLEGGNPYNLAQMAAAESPHNIAPITILTWNPPLIFPFIAMLALFSFDAAAMLWLIVMLVAFVAAWAGLRTCPTMQISSRQARALQLAFLLSFYPLALALYGGQISPLLLLGFACFVCKLFARGGERRAEFRAGAALSLTLLKPHLLLLVYLWLVVRCWRTRNWDVLKGFAVGAALIGGAAFILHPRIFEYYFAAIASPPIYWKTPTLGSWLQELLDLHETWVRVLPTLFVAAAAFPMLMAKRFAAAVENGSLVFMLVPLSLIASPYGWHFDHVLLLPVALWCIAKCEGARISPAWILPAANVAVILTPDGLPMHYLIWYPAAFLIAAAASWRRELKLSF